MAYTDMHRMFIQTIMAKPVMKATFASMLLRDWCNSSDGEHTNLDLEKVVKVINKQIGRFNMEIHLITCEVTQLPYYVLINTLQSPITKTMTAFSKNEQKIFKKIIEEIINSDEGSVPSTACINLNTFLPNMTKSDVSVMIKKLINTGWLLEENGCIYLSVRSILELEPFLKELYPDFINRCPLCKQLAFTGYRCDSCDNLGHNHCLKKYFSGSSKPRCPECKTVWKDCPFVSNPVEIENTATNSQNLPLKKRLKIARR